MWLSSHVIALNIGVYGTHVHYHTTNDYLDNRLKYYMTKPVPTNMLFEPRERNLESGRDCGTNQSYKKRTYGEFIKDSKPLCFNFQYTVKLNINENFTHITKWTEILEDAKLSVPSQKVIFNISM